MKTIKWLFFLSKRLYKKWMFLLLILLIPLSVLSLTFTASQKAGFVQIALVNEAGDTGERIIGNLNTNKKIVGFTMYDRAEDALADLKADKLDSIWIFPENIDKRIASFINGSDDDNYIVHIIAKENDLKTRLSLEILSGAVYPVTSREFFLHNVRNDPDFDLSDLSDDEICRYYDRHFTIDHLFLFSFPDGGSPVRENEQNYLTSPIRGLLSAVVLLAGLAAAMLFISDREKGVFAFAKSSKRLLIAFGFELSALLNIGFFAFCSAFLLGVHTGFLRETVIYLIFIFNTALFCTLLSQIVRSLTVFAPVTVLITVLDVFICPIFFDYTLQRIPQFFFPNTYYINSVHNNTYLRYSLFYSLIFLCVLSVIYLKKRKA